MKLKSIALIVTLSIFTSACAQLGGTKFKRSYVSIKDSNEETVGTLFIWEADTSAAVLFKEGGACMQTALAVKTINVEAEANLSDAVLQLSKTAAKVATSKSSDESTSKALAEVSGSIKEAAQSLTTTTERTAFLNMGMFYICQIAANESITPAKANELISTLITSASGMSKL